MFAFLRAALCVFIAAQFLVPATANAQTYPMSYARMLTADEARQVLNCPLCSYPASDSPMFFVRTTEGINLTLADDITARDAAELLNEMVRAKDKCDRTSYERALDEYWKMMMGLDEEVEGRDPLRAIGVFGLFNPRHDTSSLAEHVVPSFHTCGTHRVAKAKANLSRADRVKVKWSGR
jgi:hypothetical protein